MTVAELARRVSASGCRAKAEALAALLLSADADGDGSVSFPDFLRFFAARIAVLPALIPILSRSSRWSSRRRRRRRG